MTESTSATGKSLGRKRTANWGAFLLAVWALFTMFSVPIGNWLESKEGWVHWVGWMFNLLGVGTVILAVSGFTIYYLFTLLFGDDGDDWY